MKKSNKPKPIQDFDVVFYDNGNLAHRQYSYSNMKTEKNKVFTDTVEYNGFYGAHIKFKSLNDGREFHMFMSDFDDVLRAKRFIDNQIVGSFCFCRKGKTQGFRLVLQP